MLKHDSEWYDGWNLGREDALMQGMSAEASLSSNVEMGKPDYLFVSSTGYIRAAKPSRQDRTTAAQTSTLPYKHYLIASEISPNNFSKIKTSGR